MADAKIFKILVLAGDHVGPEVVKSSLAVLDVISQHRPQLKFDLDHDLAGGCSIDAHGTPITEAVLEKAAKSDAVFFGSVGGPEWADAHPNPESGLLRLRKHLDAFANIRPCEVTSESLAALSPIKKDVVLGTKFIVVRENCGGAYFGQKTESPDAASDLWVYTRQEIEQLSRVSAALARILGKNGDGTGGPATVWSSDKQNVLASGRLWRRVTMEAFAREFPDIDLKHQLADSLAMLMVKQPRAFNGIIHTDNTFGDLLSDLSGGLTGTLGILPSASLCGIPGTGRCNGIYEPVHGSAPDISGKGIANPVAQILSLAMLLRYSLGLAEEADVVEKAVAHVLESREKGGLEIRGGDLGGSATTKEVEEAVCRVVGEHLART